MNVGRLEIVLKIRASFLTLAVVALLASTLSAAARADGLSIETLRADVDRFPDDLHLRVALASEELRSGDAEAAVRHLETVVEREPEFPNADASLGIAYQRVGRNAEAIQTLERIMTRPNAPARARIHLALAFEDENLADKASSHWRLVQVAKPELRAEVELLRGLSAQRRGQSDAAREHLRRAIEYDYDGWVTIQAERALRRSSEGRPSGPHLAIQAGFEYDSNVTQESSDRLPGAPVDREDGRGVIGVDFGWRALELPGLDDVDFEVGYSGRQTLHFSLSDLNRQNHAPYVAGRWQVSKRNVLRLSALYSFELLGSDPYRHAAGVQPSLDHLLGPRAGKLRIYGWLRRDEFIDQAQTQSLERDGYDVGGGIEHSWVGRANSQPWMRTGATYGRRITEGQRDAAGYRSAYDGDRWQGSIDAGVKLPWSIRARAAGSVAYARFAHRNVIDGVGLAGPLAASRRRDLAYSVSVSVIRPFFERFDFEITYNYRDRDSNVDPYRYNGHIVGVYVRAALF